METLIVSAEKEKLTALKAFLEELNITFEVKKSKSKLKESEKPYNPEFVKKILQTEKEKSIRVNSSNLWESIL